MPFPRFTFPDDVEAWMSFSDIGSCKPVFHPSTKDEPAFVALVRTASGEDLVRARAVQMADGTHFYVSSSPFGASQPPRVLHLALRRKPVKEAKTSSTAALVVPFMSAYYAKRDDSSWKTLPSGWEKKAHAQVLHALEKDGGSALDGCGPVFVAFATECVRLIDRAAGKDLEEAVLRVRKELKFLIDHVEEEDLVRWWREAVVDRTHER